MQYRINTGGTQPDVDAIEQTIAGIDPAALVDLDHSGQVLRVSTVLDDAELLAVLNQAGLAADWQDVESVASECCGGCGG